MKTAIALLLLSAACTKPADRCTSNLDCTDPAYPFCDVTGQFPASGGDMNVCTIPPPATDGGLSDASPGGCSPGAATCTNSELTVCNSDGMTTTTAACSVGCEASGTTCKTIVPSNGLGPALAASAAQPDVVLPSGATINTDTGVVSDSGGAPIQLASLVVTNGTSSVRAFIAHSFGLSNVVVRGSASVAFVSEGAIAINGTVDASANGSAAGPGALEPPSSAVGVAGATNGGGGGGNALAGATGSEGAGGQAQTAFSPLAGGGRGGVGKGAGGGGGGAIEFVSLTSIAVQTNGVVDVGGGGGQAIGGGGAGGTIVFQSPTVQLDGTIAANGGGGGGGASCSAPNGLDASPGATAATGGGCSVPFGSMFLSEFGGAGGTAAIPAVAGGVGGGGGAVGRIDVMTLDGTFMSGPSAIISAAASSEKLVLQ
jgi:hypothetical protein